MSGSAIGLTAKPKMSGVLSHKELGAIEHHFWLNRSVARAMGVNLSEAMADGSLSEAGYAELITQCRAGGCAEACALWLSCQTGFNAKAPDHCANAEALTRLKHRSRD